MPGVSRLSAETEQVFQNIADNTGIDGLRAYANQRSPVQPQYLTRLNRPDLAILLCTYWHETIFSNSTVVDLFNKLTIPSKKLIIQVGDHGSAEGAGLAGAYSRPTVAALNWLGQHLRGDATPDTDRVVVETTPNPYADARRYQTWDDFTNPAVRHSLGQPGPGSDGRLDPHGTRSSWTRTITVAETEAEIADTLVLRGISERLAQFCRHGTSTIPRQNAAIWSCPPFSENQQISGQAHPADHRDARIRRRDHRRPPLRRHRRTRRTGLRPHHHQRPPCTILDASPTPWRCRLRRRAAGCWTR